MTTCMGMIDVIMQAGVMAKILSKNPNYTPAQLKQYLVAKYVQLIIMNNTHLTHTQCPAVPPLTSWVGSWEESHRLQISFSTTLAPLKMNSCIHKYNLLFSLFNSQLTKFNIIVYMLMCYIVIVVDHDT